MEKYSNGKQNQLDIAPKGPILEIFEISLETIREVRLNQRRAAKASHLSKPSETRFRRMAMPISLVDLPKQFIRGPAAKRMWPRPNNAHISAQYINQLRHFIDARAANETANAGNAIIVATG